MAGSVEWVVVTRYGHSVSTRFVEVLEAGHPVPDEAGAFAAQRILDAVSDAGAGDLVLALISRGGSALLSLPAGGVSLDQKARINSALIRSGAPISEINCVRKHLSAIKGGRLLQAAAPARLVTLAVSDVPGDEPAVIGSGPTVTDITTQAEARAVLAKYEIDMPQAVGSVLRDPDFETPKPSDVRMSDYDFRIIASPRKSSSSIADLAEGKGVNVVQLGCDIEGEAKVFARELASESESKFPGCFSGDEAC